MKEDEPSLGLASRGWIPSEIDFGDAGAPVKATIRNGRKYFSRIDSRLGHWLIIDGVEDGLPGARPPEHALSFQFMSRSCVSALRGKGRGTRDGLDGCGAPASAARAIRPATVRPAYARARFSRVAGWFGAEFDALGCDHPEIERAAQIFWREVGLRVTLSTIKKLLREGVGLTAAITC